MPELPTDLAAPGPEVVQATPEAAVAYTDFRRDEADEGTAPWPARVSVTGARLEATDHPVELVELDGRSGVSGRAFLAAVAEWERVADHDHVAPVVGSGKKPRPWVATTAAGTLADRTASGPDFACWVGVCVAEALRYAHENGVVHAALEPGRVRLEPAPDHEWPFPRVGGFGLARRLREDAGEVARRAPEAVDPDRYGEVGEPTDVYGLALTLYELLAGDRPYPTDGDPREAILGSAPVPPSTVEPTLPGTVDDLLLDGLAKRPADRPDLPAFRDRLVEVLEAEHVESSGSDGDAPASFPFLDGDRAEWRTECPSCGRSVTNTFESFVAHWRDAVWCDGPPSTPPARAAHSPEAWEEVVASVEAAVDEPNPSAGAADHPLWRALAEEDVVEVGGVAVASPDGSYPWLAFPRRGWRVPCPACGATVYNAERAMKAHWADAPDCSGPPDDFDTA